jgi:hypothetical protein
MPHKRSPKSKKRRQTANTLLHQYSYKDPQNGEIVHTLEFSKIVKNKLVETLGYVPCFVLNHEYGEVLNSTTSIIHTCS